MLKRALLALAASLTFVLPSHAHSVRELQLDEIINSAAVAFEGTVIETHSAKDATNRLVTYTTFAVGDVLKGKVGSTHTIKQLGGEVDGEAYNATLRTKFSVGESTVVFLYGESSIGFSSPVGTAQGNFRIVQDESGAAVSNGRDFTVLTERMAGQQDVAKAVAKSRGNGKKLGLDEFKQLVRGHVGAAR